MTGTWGLVVIEQLSGRFVSVEQARVEPSVSGERVVVEPANALGGLVSRTIEQADHPLQPTARRRLPGISVARRVKNAALLSQPHKIAMGWCGACEEAKIRVLSRVACSRLMIMKTIHVTTGGQVSVPSEIRHRWGTRKLHLEDRGDEIVLRPAPDDPVAAARGALKKVMTTSSDELRRLTRAEDAEIEARKLRQR